MNEVTIQRIYRGEVETKYGLKPKIAIKIVEKEIGGETTDDKWISSFKTKGTENWKEGDKVKIVLTVNNGYLNFELPDETEMRLRALEDAVFGSNVEEGIDKQPEVETEDIPF